MKILVVFILAMAMVFAGCNGVNIAFRGVVINTTQDVETGGRINNQPKSGSSSVAAEKTTDATLDIPLK